jgi:hypothetical protein
MLAKLEEFGGLVDVVGILFVCFFMVFSVTFNNISVILWWRKPENLEKTTYLSQVADKRGRYRII